MKIAITANSKKMITVDEMPEVKRMIADFKNDEMTAAEYAVMAANAIYRYNCGYNCCDDILQATATISKNSRIYNRYTNNSRSLDIWIEFTSYSLDQGFIIGGAYLSDIWEICGDDDINAEIVKRMYIRQFKEVK